MVWGFDVHRPAVWRHRGHVEQHRSVITRTPPIGPHERYPFGLLTLYVLCMNRSLAERITDKLSSESRVGDRNEALYEFCGVEGRGHRLG